MKTLEKKGSTKNGMLRLIFVAFAILLEVCLVIFILMTRLGRYAEVIAIVSRIMGLFLVLAIYSQNRSASIKMPWIILILIFPAVGVSLYLLTGLSGSTAKMKKRYQMIDDELVPVLTQDESVISELCDLDRSCSGISQYILSQSGFPVYKNNKVQFYPDAAVGLEAQKQAMREAKSFIFLEYFAIEDAESWREVEDILAMKASEGIEVRVFYDDIGSIGFVNMSFARRLSDKGIKCKVFNPMIPVFNFFLDNRDHRKMTIIDNRIGFTGGYNLANEYFNITSPYGYWKDTGVSIEGDAVRSMTVAFIEMWNAVRGSDNKDADISVYTEKQYASVNNKGYVQFYADNPMYKNPVGEDVYLSIINRAVKYIYIMTPYLIITEEMRRMLGLAAKRGVDVRIITPGIPDKKIIYQLTRSYYAGLVHDGVRIYEYSPGFCHAKMCVSDDMVATCGTINMDFRSLYHHFEDGCLMIDCGAVTDIKADFDNSLRQSTEVTEKYRTGRSAMLRFGQLVLRLFAPLL